MNYVCLFKGLLVSWVTCLLLGLVDDCVLGAGCVCVAYGFVDLIVGVGGCFLFMGVLLICFHCLFVCLIVLCI